VVYNGSFAGNQFGGVIRDGANGTTVAFVKDGNSNLYLTGSNANTYSGGTTIFAGGLYLQKTDGTYAIPGNITFSPTTSWSETYDLQQGVYLMANQQIAPTAVLSFTDQGNHQIGLYLTGYTQTIGGLQYTHAGAIPDGLVANGNQASWTLSANGTLIISPSAGSWYTYQGYLENSTGGPSTGVVNLTMTGPGLQELGGAYITYTGVTTISGGTLMLSDATNFASTIALAGGTLALNDTAGTVETFGQSLGGHGALVVTGIAPIAITGANTYNAGTFIDGGTLQVGNAAAIPRGAGKGDVTVSGSGALDLAGINTSINGLWGDGTVDNSANTSATLNVGNNNATSTFFGTIQNSNSAAGGLLALTKVGNGTLTLSGTNTYQGGTTVENGALVLSDNEAIADGSNLIVGNPAAFAAPVVPAANAGSAVAPAIAAVPEPGTLALLAAVLGIAAMYRRLRRR
jgi:autotransporter-associated beta strand protein